MCTDSSNLGCETSSWKQQRARPQSAVSGRHLKHTRVKRAPGCNIFNSAYFILKMNVFAMINYLQVGIEAANNFIVPSIMFG